MDSPGFFEMDHTNPVTEYVAKTAAPDVVEAPTSFLNPEVTAECE
jgi:hypothetical protein